MTKNYFPDIKTLCIDNLYIKMYFFKSKNTLHKLNKNNFNYFLLVSSGRIKLDVNKNSSVFNYPNIVSIPNNKVITIESLEDDTVVYIIEALRDPTTKNILDPESIPAGINLSMFGINEND